MPAGFFILRYVADTAHPKEEWRTCVQEINYEVSNHGRVRRKGATSVLRSSSAQDNTLCVTLNRVRYCVKFLVASQFLEEKPGYVLVHIDGDSKNNRVDNL